MSENTSEEIKEIIPTVYNDGLKPATTESGKLLALIPRTINAALAPLRQWIAQREYNVSETEKLLAEKLKNVSADKITTPEAYVAVPTIQAISYCIGNDELRNLYANLLSKAMCVDTKESVHPSFVEIIKQLSPMDAIVFKKIMEQKVTPMINIVMENNEHHYRVLYRYVTMIDPEKVEDVGVSIDNLTKQGLIDVPEDKFYATDSLYDLIYNSTFYMNLKSNTPATPDGYELSSQKKMISITNLGKLFYNICVKEL